MYDEIKSHYFTMLLFPSHKQKLAAAAAATVLAYATMLCYVLRLFEYAWQFCSGQICPPPRYNKVFFLNAYKIKSIHSTITKITG